MKMLRRITYILSSALMTLGLCACEDRALTDLDYLSEGEDVTLTVPVALPRMDVKSRASLEDWQINEVNNVWIRTYSAITGNATSEWVTVEDINLNQTETEQKVEIKSKSGMSYIVAVANVDNTGVRKDAPADSRTLRELLSDNATDTWQGFLDIAAAVPSTAETVNSPNYNNNNGLPMAGAFTSIKVNGVHTPSDSWQIENFTPYPIPASGSGKVDMAGTGAIHLRRLVSEVTFNIIPGSPANGAVGAGQNLEVKVNSYRIINVPRFSWVYERSGADGRPANFGDACTADDSGDYYFSTPQYTGASIDTKADGSSTFSFWQGENKHTALAECDTYSQRQIRVQKEIDGKNEENSPHDQWKENTGIFKSLCGETWSPANMATYVLVNCDVKYPSTVNVNDNGEPGLKDANRTGSATFMVHLGYIGGPADPAEKSAAARDFNCYRNTRYTYNIYVNGLNDIRVEAFHTGEFPGVEGLVSDVENPSVILDSHYHAFNINLTASDLEKFNPSNGSGFGFILTTYDAGVEKTFQESDFLDAAGTGMKSWDEIDSGIRKYLDWVELRPTTEPDVLAEYKPRKGSRYYDATVSGMDDKTFNLVDAAGGISDSQRSESGWYTVFVNEYTYEADGADEEAGGGNPVWWNYVNQNPRRFYIKVSRSVSADGSSIYARSKYAGSQESILTYYNMSSVTEPQATGQVRGAAVGVERDNESLGLNLRYSFDVKEAQNANNGRYNCWQYTNYEYRGNSWTNAGNRKWNYYLDPTKPQEIPELKVGDTEIIRDARTGAAIGSGKTASMLPKIYNFRGSLATNNNGVNSYSAQTSDYDNATIEAISACMNRNRDNNGDGVIQPEEMRWYVPSTGKYLRLILGNRTLGDYALMDYRTAGLPFKSKNPDNSQNDVNGLYMFFGSDSRVLWGMEGMSTSGWCQWGEESPVAPWQVRCIRNLGTNLAAQITTDDKTVPAYIHTPRSSDFSKDGGIVTMKYYDQTTAVRSTQYSGNGRGQRQMPVHTINDATYNTTYPAFEISQVTDAGNYVSYNGVRTYYDGTITGNDWKVYVSIIESQGESSGNPCTIKGDGWRLPNLKELAIMKNLGYFNGAYSDINYIPSPFFVSCTIGAYVKSGAYTSAQKDPPYFDNSDTEHYFMSAFRMQVAQSWNEATKYVRCVRDHPYNGN